jgi:subtilisin family serine protease
MKPKNLLLASGIALALSGGQCVLAADGAQHSTTASKTKSLAQSSPYYVQYKPGHKTDLQAFIQQASTRSQAIEITHELDRYNTLVVMVPDTEVSTLRTNTNVTLFEAVPEHKLMAQVTPWNVDQFQAREIWDKDRDGLVDVGSADGSGFTTCIIDSGFYAAHSDFQGVSYSGESQVILEAFTEDGGSHGTHVAGTINAMNNTEGVVGVMPGAAELYIVKVFDNTGTWVPGQSNLASAAEACRDAGANVINMSLGGGFSAFEDSVFQDLYDNENIISVAAAGNDGNATNSYPANYDSVISVGGLNSTEGMYNSSQHPPTGYDPLNPPANVEWDVVELAGGGEQVLSTVSYVDGGVPIFQVTNDGQDYSGGKIAETGNGDVTQNLVEGGLCDTGDIDPSWNGSVVLCERGDIAFSAKMNNVADNGGLAVILFNNESGALNATCAGNCTSGAALPSVTILQSEGLFLRNNGLGLPTRVVSDDGSGCVGCSGGYDFFSGTSMATPGVAGALSLIWNACGGPTELTNKEVRQLARDSAKDMTGVYEPTNTPYGAGWDPYTGWGLPQIRKAVLMGYSQYGPSCDITGLDIIFEDGFDL